MARSKALGGRGFVVLAALGALALLLATAAADDGAAAIRKCAGFPNQAAAQDYFLANGGAPGELRGLDPEGDGVACEELGAPYKGYATIGYNKAKRFFYGVATMPSGPAGAEARCLEGNRHFFDGPRKLNIYRVMPGTDKPLLEDPPGAAAEADPSLGKLFWKVSRALVPGTYYVQFEDRIRDAPYEPTECPGFASAPRRLPRG